MWFRNMNMDTSGDSVHVPVPFPNLAIEFLREPRPAAGAKERPIAVNTAPPAPSPEPAPATPAAAPAATAEFDVEVDGEVFKVRVSGAGMTVMSGTGAATGSAPPANPAAPPSRHGTLA